MYLIRPMNGQFMIKKCVFANAFVYWYLILNIEFIMKWMIKLLIENKIYGEG